MKVKSIIALALLLPVITLGETCFEAVSAVPALVPKTICIESVKETATENVLELSSSDTDLPSKLKITQSSRHNEERVNFTAVGGLKEESDEPCGDWFYSALHISGEIAQGSIHTPGLSVSVVTETSHDICHSYPDVETYQYKLVK